MPSSPALDVVDVLQSPESIDRIRLWDSMMQGARDYARFNGFVQVHNVPLIVGVTGACENVDTLFKVDFFGRQAYLAQSDQLYLELLTQKLNRVSAEIQSFRAEPHADNRRLAQFTLFELEHVGDLTELRRHITGLLVNAVAEVLEDGYAGRPALTHLVERHSARHPLPSITYTEAVDHLSRRPGFGNLRWGDDLGAVEEAALVALLGPCFITHYPRDIKFFNMRANEDDPRVVNSCDLLLPFAGESAGAAERETDYETIVARLKGSDMYRRLIELGGTDADFEWYLAAHRGREVRPHAGAGIGMARVAQFIMGAEDIRDAVPFVINRDNLL